jgi:hypothetical protein
MSKGFAIFFISAKQRRHRCVFWLYTIRKKNYNKNFFFNLTLQNLRTMMKWIIEQQQNKENHTTVQYSAWLTWLPTCPSANTTKVATAYLFLSLSLYFLCVSGRSGIALIVAIPTKISKKEGTSL